MPTEPTEYRYSIFNIPLNVQYIEQEFGAMHADFISVLSIDDSTVQPTLKLDSEFKDGLLLRENFELQLDEPLTFDSFYLSTNGAGVGNLEIMVGKNIKGRTRVSAVYNSVTNLFLSTSVNVGAAAVQIPAANLANRVSLVLHNNSPNTIYLGGAGVVVGAIGVANSGLPLVANEKLGIVLSQGANLYAIAAGANNDLRVLEGSQ